MSRRPILLLKPRGGTEDRGRKLELGDAIDVVKGVFDTDTRFNNSGPAPAIGESSLSACVPAA